MQASAERRKRAQILDSEGTRQSEVNIAEGKKQSTVLASEGQMTQEVNLALGEAQAIIAKAKAAAEGIEVIAKALQKTGGKDAVALRIAEQYVGGI